MRPGLAYLAAMDTLAPNALTDASLALAVDELAARDPGLAGIFERHGVPPMWDRPPGFTTLVQLILEQQVSIASAGAAYERLRSEIGEPTPAAVLRLDDREMLAVGFSRQKSGYVRDLARRIESGELDIDALAGADDDSVRERLVAVKGIGPWTADTYLLMALRRPDVWPAADIALAAAIADTRGLTARPSASEVESIGLAWRPWRAVAARLLWLDYLRRRGR
jgi:DNA-3-methyladenine glycosylase II